MVYHLKISNLLLAAIKKLAYNIRFVYTILTITQDASSAKRMEREK